MSQREPTEEELREALEAELKRVRVGDVILQTVVSLINVGARRAGLAPGTEGERDLAQVEQAVDAVRALLPLLEREAAQQGPEAQDLAPIRDALARLQLIYAQAGGADTAGQTSGEPAAATPAGDDPAGAEQPKQGPGPAQTSGRLWVPGQ